MISRWLAVVVVVIACAACGSVAQPGNGPSDGGNDAASGPAVAYHGAMAQTTPVTFGTLLCTYTITFTQLTVDLAIRPSGEVTSGQVQNRNIEAVLSPCTNAPSGPSTAVYTLQSARTDLGGMELTFQGAANNTPKTTLTLNLAATGATYSAALNVHRTDLAPPFDWLVMATVPLTRQ